MAEQSNQIDNNLIIKAQKDFMAREKLFTYLDQKFV